MRLISCVLFVFLLKTVSLLAQPGDLGYDPPMGWTYVMNLDSTNQHYVHAHNDTIVLRARDIRQNTLEENRRFSLYSLNGGATWDTLPVVKETNGFVLLYDEDFFPNSNRLFRIVQKQGPVPDTDTIYMKVSEDLGKSWTVYNYGESSQMFLGNISSVYFHPLDPNEGFWISGSAEQTFVYRTHDGGKSWKPLPLPPPGDGRGVSYQILPDVRSPKLWNVLVNGNNHYTIEDYYQTRDDGKTFKSINHWGDYAGIANEGTIRKEWEILLTTSSSTLRYNIGYYDFLESGDSISHDWATIIYGSSANGNWPSGYKNGLTLSNYTFFSTNPHHAFVNGIESFSDTTTSQVLKRNYHIWETRNDGETWSMIWLPEPPVSKIFLDEKKNTLYVISFYNGYNSANPAHYELWKRQIATSIENNSQTPANSEDLKIFPNPAENSAQISFKNSTSGKVEITLYDILGTKIRTIYSDTQETGEQKLIWNIPAEIPSGTYFLKLESGGQSASQKLVIMR